MANSPLWIPTAIHKLPNQVKGGRGGGEEREKVIARTKLTDALSGIVLAPAQELFTCISFFSTTCFGLYLKSFIFFIFLKSSLILLYHGPTVKLKALPVYTCYPNLCSTISHVDDESTSNRTEPKEVTRKQQLQLK